MNKIGKWISEKENVDFPFRPHREFYQKVGINKKRFWQIYKGEAQNVQVIELQRIAQFFNLDFKDLL